MDPILFDAVPKTKLKKFQQYIRSQSGLLLYYPLNESSGDIAYNRAGVQTSAKNGTITSAALAQSGVVGNAMGFDGVATRITGNIIPSIDTPSTLSIIAIINPTDFGGASNGYIFGHDNGFAAGWAFTLRNTGSIASLRIGAFNSSFICAQSNIITLGVFQMVGVTFDGTLTPNTQLDFYVNGVNKGNASSSLANTMGNAAGAGITIGDDTTALRKFKGKIQHIAIFSGKLSDAKMLKFAQLAGLA